MSLLFIGKTANESATIKAIKGAIVTPEIAEAVSNVEIYWNDLKSEHYFYDFKVGNKWISSRVIDNELTNFLIEIYEG